MHTILLVEDERTLRELVGDYLTRRSGGQWRVLPAADGGEALLLAASQPLDLAILDVMLPDIDGFALCRELRSGSDLPILFLSARSAEEDRLRGYGLGADDYMTKPFSQAELFAKAAALLRRSKGEMGRDLLVSGGVAVDIPAHAALVDGRRVDLPPKELAILRLLLEERGRVLRREDLLLRLWGWDYEGSDRVVDTHVKNLRRALGPWARCLKTVFKTGYKWEEE
ncbi:MAG TPA: response regulator transcription factor [Candidatus Pelethomonas intestinigallinarum]|nr:response regulator transcription factor [Candidatus Pelethomonas intestinigallinarum]